MKILLSAWGAKEYNPSPSIRTLRIWASSGQIYPQPEKVGRDWMVDEDAIRMRFPEMSKDASVRMTGRALSILHSSK